MNDLSIFRNGEALDYTKMGEIEILPDALSFDAFVNAFKNSPNASNTQSNAILYTTPAGKIRIYLPQAHGHFFRYGKFGNGKIDRQTLTGSLMPILDKPLFVTKDEADTLYFYKPFKSKNGEFLDLISVSVAKNGRFEYRTTYEDTLNQVLDMIDGYEVIYKARLE